jgi:hypothetical protein
MNCQADRDDTMKYGMSFSNAMFIAGELKFFFLVS